VTSRGSAARFARALFDVALQERADLDAVRQQLTGFAELVTGHEVLERTLMNPVVPAVRKRAVIEALFERGGQPTPILRKLLALLADSDRLALVPELAAAFEQRLMDHRRVVRAELATAIELPADQVAELRAGLARATGRDVQMETRVDPALIGGAVARIGSTVYDGSVTRQLERLKQSLVESAQS
jgi:F-type H+-transporting ATPase subunit delta